MKKFYKMLLPGKNNVQSVEIFYQESLNSLSLGEGKG